MSVFAVFKLQNTSACTTSSATSTLKHLEGLLRWKTLKDNSKSRRKHRSDLCKAEQTVLQEMLDINRIFCLQWGKKKNSSRFGASLTVDLS